MLVHMGSSLFFPRTRKAETTKPKVTAWRKMMNARPASNYHRLRAIPIVGQVLFTTPAARCVGGMLTDVTRTLH